MVDKKRLYLMIGMARFRDRNEGKAFRINGYYQRDYIAFALIRNFILTTIAYVLLVAFLSLFNLEDILSNLNDMEVRPVIAALVIGYLVFLGIFSVIAYVLAKLRYVRMQSEIRQYKDGLVRMGRMYREEDHGTSDLYDAEDAEDEDETDEDEEDEEES